MTRFLMCPPDFFRSESYHPPDGHIPVAFDPAQARSQWQSLCDLLNRGPECRVQMIKPVSSMPALSVTAHGGLIRKRTAVAGYSALKCKRNESVHFDKIFKRSGYVVKGLPEPFLFEGERQATFMGNDLYLGVRFPKERLLEEPLAEIFRCEVFGLELDGPQYYLDNAFCVLDEETALVDPGAFSGCSRMVLRENIRNFIEVGPEEARGLACNSIVAGRQIIMSGRFPRLVGELEKLKFEVYALNLSAFIQAGIGVRSLVLRM